MTLDLSGLNTVQANTVYTLNIGPDTFSVVTLDSETDLTIAQLASRFASGMYASDSANALNAEGNVLTLTRTGGADLSNASMFVDRHSVIRRERVL